MMARVLARWTLTWLFLLAAGQCVSNSEAALEIDCLNGIQARIYSAAEIQMYWVVQKASRSYLSHPLSGDVELLTGPADARLMRQDVQAFIPLNAAAVAEAVAAVHGIAPELEVEIFILPAPPAAAQVSLSRRNVIFLSPAYGPVAPSTLAYVVTHELGHVLTWAFLDQRPERWAAYREKRGLKPEASGERIAHANREREILAEDLRFLFGGSLANVSGTLENHELPTPDLVIGLRELLAGYLTGPPPGATATVQSRAFPTPCNPHTTIEMMLPAGMPQTGAAAAELTLYDLRGRQVRKIRGGRITAGRLTVTWPGTLDSGAPVATGQYLYLLRLGTLVARGTVMIVR